MKTPDPPIHDLMEQLLEEDKVRFFRFSEKFCEFARPRHSTFKPMRGESKNQLIGGEAHRREVDDTQAGHGQE